ncbi:MAG: TIR domain-containing protein, partial [Acidobacteria bacterium]|nr:TIR domain-containing protein [Acidobacteriota bacterium]
MIVVLLIDRGDVYFRNYSFPLAYLAGILRQAVSVSPAQARVVDTRLACSGIAGKADGLQALEGSSPGFVMASIEDTTTIRGAGHAFRGHLMTNGCVFISYSSQDVKVAEVIERSLEEAGFEVWRDQSRLQGVADWSQSIAETLTHDVDAVSLVWSRAAADSKFVKNEWLTARALGIPIVPCRLSNAPDLPAPLYNLQYMAIDEGKQQAPGVSERFRSLEPRSYSYEYTFLPRNAYIPFRPNPRFVGRHTDLVALYLKMIGNINTIGITQVGTVGMGGIGKTQLAVEFSYRFGFYFEEGGIFWIQAANPSDWLAQFVAIARDRLELSASDPHSPDAAREYLNQLQQYFERHKQHVLVIMDNVSDPLQLHDQDALLGVSPLNLGCNLLFTTRRRFEMPGVMSHSVDVLSEIASYELLTHLRQPDTVAEEEAAHQICASLGHLPLAVTLASGYLKNRPGVSFQTYLGILNRDRLEIIDRNKLLPGNLATRHETAIAVTLG